MIDPNVWQRNIEALRQVDPKTAQRLEAAKVPQQVEPATARDGTPTWLVKSPDGRGQWFGRSSMPTIRAEGLLSQFDAGSGNVALAGIGTGLEAKLLCERLGRHRAVVVLETEPLNVVLALRLWDLSGHIRNHQLVVMVGDDQERLGKLLLEWCRQRPGFEVPARMLAWPHLNRQQTSLYQRLLEEVAGRVWRERQDAARRIVSALVEASRKGRKSHLPPALAVMTTVPGLATGRLTEWLAEAGREVGSESTACWPENPLKAGALSALTAAQVLLERFGQVQVVLAVGRCGGAPAVLAGHRGCQDRIGGASTTA